MRPVDLPDQPIHLTGEGCLFVLDDAGVFFAAERQELHLFNTSATLLWCALESGESTDSLVQSCAEATGMPAHEARGHVATLLDQWWAMGCIDAPRMSGGPAASFETALARVLCSEELRAAFARDPLDCARQLRLHGTDLEVFAALDPAAIERQAVELTQRRRARRAAAAQDDAILVPTPPGQRPALEAAVQGRLAGLLAPPTEHTYQLLDVRVRIRFGAAAQETAVHPVFAHLEVDDAATPDAILDIVEGDGTHIVLDGLLPVGRCSRLDELAPIVKSLVALRAINSHRFLVEVHGGVVSNGEHCLLMPAASGSGKSTLTAGLVAAGFQYFSDEVALLEEDDLAVRPFPLALGVKRGSTDVLAPVWPGLASLRAHERVDGEVVRYVAPPRSALPDAATRGTVRWLIFPRYVPSAATVWRAVTRPEALRRLVDECIVLPAPLDEQKVARLVQWMRTLECAELTVGSLREAIELVRAHLA